MVSRHVKYTVMIILHPINKPVCCCVAMVTVISITGNAISAGKHIMTILGVDVGPPRLPVLPIGDEDVKLLEAHLKDIGFFTWN